MMQQHKSKALELCQMFGMTGLTEEGSGFYTLDLSHAKKCAIICVEQIIKTHKNNYYNGHEIIIDYWQKVLCKIKEL